MNSILKITANLTNKIVEGTDIKFNNEVLLQNFFILKKGGF